MGGIIAATRAVALSTVGAVATAEGKQQTAALSWRARLGRREEAAAVACSRAAVLLGRHRRNLLERHRPAREPLPLPAHAPWQPARPSCCCAARAPSPQPAHAAALLPHCVLRCLLHTCKNGRKEGLRSGQCQRGMVKTAPRRTKQPCPRPGAKSERF